MSDRSKTLSHAAPQNGLRILMYCAYFPPQYSGAARQALSLAHHLKRLGHRVEFLTIRWKGLSSRDEVEGFPVHRIEQGGGEKHREFRLWWNMLRFCLARRNDFDIVHSHGAYYTNSFVGVAGRLVGWRSLAKASLAENDLAGVGRGLAGRLHSFFLSFIDSCVAISRELTEEFLAAGVPAEKVVYLPNGVDTNRFVPADPEARRAARSLLNLANDCFVALTVGVFDKRKNIGWLMQQWSRSNGFGTGALLLAVGPQSREDADGSFIASLRELAEYHPDLLRLCDHSEDIVSYFQAADCFILPSHSEGMPNVILEALASGIPCLATRVSGTCELVREGVSGFTFAVESASELEAALRSLLRQDRGVLGQNARHIAVDEYSLAHLAERYETLYRELLGLPLSDASHHLTETEGRHA